jgi:hypothetical protein
VDARVRDAMPTSMGQEQGPSTTGPANSGGKRRFRGTTVASYGLAGFNSTKSSISTLTPAIRAAVLATLAAINAPGAQASELTLRRDGTFVKEDSPYGADYPSYLVVLVVMFVTSLVVKFQFHFSFRAPVARLISSIIIASTSAISWHLVTHPTLSFNAMWEVAIANDARGYTLGIIVGLASIVTIVWQVMLKTHYKYANRL